MSLDCFKFEDLLKTLKARINILPINQIRFGNM